MEHSQKNTDCYFFYYSTCLKGDACAFRHEASALGCETMCSYWQQGNCLNEHCNFRHMELKKNRKSIPCYWETQPGGCRKPHCCFMHKNARGPAAAEPNNPVRNNELTSKPVNQEWSNRQDDGKYDSDLRTTLDGSSTESDQGRGGSEAGSFIGSPAVDPLVVNFEEANINLANLQSTLSNLPNLQNLPSLSNSLGIPGLPGIPGNVLNIQNNANNVGSNYNIPRGATALHNSSQNTGGCPPRVLSFARRSNMRSYNHGQSFGPLQNPSTSPLLQRPHYSSTIRPQQSQPHQTQTQNQTQTQTQTQTPRFQFPFLGFASYGRF